MERRSSRQVEILILALLAAILPLKAAELQVESSPRSDKTYERIDLQSVASDLKMPVAEWMNWVHLNNPSVAGDIMSETLCSIDVQTTDPEDSRESIEPFILEARKEAALWGANHLYLTDKVSDVATGRVIRVSFTASRIQYKDFLIPPSFLSELPYSPLPESYITSQLQEWDTVHFGRVKMSFISEHGQVIEREVVNFLANVQTGTPVRVVLRDGSDWRGTFSGLDVDNQVWIRPQGLGGHFVDRCFQAKDVEAVGLLN